MAPVEWHTENTFNLNAKANETCHKVDCHAHTPRLPLIYAFAFLIDFGKVSAARATRTVNIKQMQEPPLLFRQRRRPNGRCWGERGRGNAARHATN